MVMVLKTVVTMLFGGKVIPVQKRPIADRQLEAYPESLINGDSPRRDDELIELRMLKI